MSIYIYLIVYAAIIVFLIASVRVANENERFVVISLGRYFGIKGPGLLLKWPNTSVNWYRVMLNDEGQYLGDGLVKVGNAVFPAEGTDTLKSGDAIKISSFMNKNITVVKST